LLISHSFLDLAGKVESYQSAGTKFVVPWEIPSKGLLTRLDLPGNGMIQQA
jgi:hypothetical protein